MASIVAYAGVIVMAAVALGGSPRIFKETVPVPAAAPGGGAIVCLKPDGANAWGDIVCEGPRGAPPAVVRGGPRPRMSTIAQTEKSRR